MISWLWDARMEPCTCGRWKPATWTGYCMVSLNWNCGRMWKWTIWFFQESLPRKSWMPVMRTQAIRVVAVDRLRKWVYRIPLSISLGMTVIPTNGQLLTCFCLFFCRGLRHRNFNAIRHATQRGIHQLQQLHAHNNQHGDFLMKNRSSPLIIQGLRTNPKGRISSFESLCF